MSENINIVKQCNAAFESKNKEAFRASLHKDYTFKGPLMNFNSVEEAIEFLGKCPFTARTQNSQFVAQEDKVVHIFDWSGSAPFQGTIKMVEILTIKEEKIFQAELIYDSAQFPKEAREQLCS